MSSSLEPTIDKPRYDEPRRSLGLNLSQNTLKTSIHAILLIYRRGYIQTKWSLFKSSRLSTVNRLKNG